MQDEVIVPDPNDFVVPDDTNVATEQASLPEGGPVEQSATTLVCLIICYLTSKNAAPPRCAAPSFFRSL